MFDFVKKLMFARELQMEKGELILLHQRTILLPLKIFTELMSYVDKDPRKIKEIYDISKAAVREGFALEVQRKYGLRGRKLIEWLINIAQLGGWGQFELIKLDEKKKTAIVHIYECPIGKEFPRKTNRPIDHIWRGCMAGGISRAFKDDIDYVETKCIAKGDKFCEFIAKPRKEFLKNPTAEVKRQLGI